MEEFIILKKSDLKDRLSKISVLVNEFDEKENPNWWKFRGKFIKEEIDFLTPLLNSPTINIEEIWDASRRLSNKSQLYSPDFVYPILNDYLKEKVWKEN